MSTILSTEGIGISGGGGGEGGMKLNWNFQRGGVGILGEKSHGGQLWIFYGTIHNMLQTGYELQSLQGSKKK